MTKGRVKWFDDRKNYGFISDGGRFDVMVHFSVIEGRGYRSLTDGEEVEFEAKEGPKGRIATRVIRVVDADPTQRVAPHLRAARAFLASAGVPARRAL